MMKLRALSFCVLSCAFLMVGCSTTSNQMQYKYSTKNVLLIEDYMGSNGLKVKTIDFTSAPGVNESPMCRAVGSISFGSGKTAAQFIHDAFQEELFLAKAYSNSSSQVISGRVDKLDFSSISPANWEIGLTLSSSNGYSYSIENKYTFDTSWAAISACKNVTDAFALAVQSTLNKAVSDARFKALLAP